MNCLLKARLLDDGGYYHQALQVLSRQIRLLPFPECGDRLEYGYRIGRIYDALNRKAEAIACISDQP